MTDEGVKRMILMLNGSPGTTVTKTILKIIADNISAAADL